ncbi:MAG: hypothetical protein HZA58_08140 [Acidimicrobiia bacterium]|nr:hypothetical protein [Acidimicrobiia bacterium]
MSQLTEQMSAGPARIRVDVTGTKVPEHVLESMEFLNYRLAEVRVDPQVTLGDPDLVWNLDAPLSVEWDGRTMRFDGPWAVGPIQKAIISLLTLKLEDHGLHPFHSAAVRYHGKTVLLLGGESNHGKSMSQIEACRRGGQLISTETTVIDEKGVAVLGSKTVFIKNREKGTERADKAAPERGAQIFFGDTMPTWTEYRDASNVDVVLVPAIDGNFDPSLKEMIPYEREYQSLHSVQNYLHLNELLVSGWPMPVVDTVERRRSRAAFLGTFCVRPYYMIRAANPQALMDEADKVLR